MAKSTFEEGFDPELGSRPEKILKRLSLRIDRRRLALLGCLVILVLFISNYWVQTSYNRLEKDLNSIYEDRLMPSHYLFRIQSLLLRKKLIQEHGELNKQEKVREIAVFDLQIDSLLGAYDKTYLTREEAREWAGFRESLRVYDSMETRWRSSPETELAGTSALFDQAFENSMGWLAQLNTLQTTEGGLIRKAGMLRIKTATLQSYIRISLVVVLLALGVSLIVGSSQRPQTKGELYN